MKAIITISLISSIFLTGCGTIAKGYRYEDGQKIQVFQVELNKDGAVKYQRGDIVVEMDSRRPTVWERFVQPIIRSAADSAKSSVNVNQ